MSIQKSLSIFAAAMLLIISLPNMLFSQSVQVTKVLDGNLLQLKNGQIVRLSDIYVPGILAGNKNLSPISGEIKDFSQKYFVNRYFKMKYNRTLADSTILVYLYREYAAGDDEDVATVFLKNGYAACLDTSDLARQYKYAEFEKEAQNSKLGMWSVIPAGYFKNSDSSAFNKTNDTNNAVSLTRTHNTERKILWQSGDLRRPPVFKDPTLAGVLSFIAPGAGQFYNEEFFGGILYLGGTGFCYYKYFSSVHEENGKFKADMGYLLAGAVIHILSVVEASKSAKEYNKEVYFSLNKAKDNYYFSLRLPL
ncbi:MAG TPA: thermonuclease family protein [Ignavibacteriales bacterium]|nr:thermonuclease family protein [Ignavibacteriales bacterium]